MNKIISFVTAFKKFKGSSDIIQKSAMYSWKANDIQVFVPASEVDTKKVCKDYSNIKMLDGVRRGRDIGYNTQTPILKDLIEQAILATETTMVALINSDIILKEDFVKQIEDFFETHGYDVFLTGTRYDIKLNYCVSDEVTYKRVQKESQAVYDSFSSADIFITSKFMWRKLLTRMPDFILGRYCWDNWIHLYAQLNNFRRYNCTRWLHILHPIHGHEHIYYQEKVHGKEAPSVQHNMKLWFPVMEIYGAAEIKGWPET